MHRSRPAPSKQHASLATHSAERKALAIENDMPTRRVTRSQSREIEDYSERVRSGQYGGGGELSLVYLLVVGHGLERIKLGEAILFYVAEGTRYDSTN